MAKPKEYKPKTKTKRTPVLHTDPEAKAKAVQDVIVELEQAHGKGVLMKLDDAMIDRDIEVIPTGSIQLNHALGVGGYPRGRIIEIYGPAGGGKTTLTLHAIAECQIAGGTCAFIDAEHALDLKYAKTLGVVVEDVLISQPDCGEQALDIVDALARSGGVDLIVIDSVAALTPRAELEGDMGAPHMALQARLMSQALRKLTSVAARSGTTVVFINQLRQKIGVMFGPTENTTGGNALKFYSSVRLDVRRVGKNIENALSQPIGNHAKVKVAKNKVAPPFAELELDIIWGEGISKGGDLLTMGTHVGVVDKSGAWYSFDCERIGQGYNNAVSTITKSSELQKAITEAIMKILEAKRG